MSSRFQFSLRSLLVVTLVTAGAAVLLRLFMADLTDKGAVQSEFHFLAVGALVTTGSMYLGGPKAVFWVCIAMIIGFAAASLLVPEAL